MNDSWPQSLFDEASDMVLLVSISGRCLLGNKPFHDFTGIEAEQLPSLALADLVADAQASALIQALTGLKDGAKIESVLAHVRTVAGEAIWADVSARRTGDRIFCILRNATARMWRAELNKAEQTILSGVIDGRALPQVLETACRFLESLVPGALCSILLVDHSQRCLTFGAAPSLPRSYSNVLEGLAIGPNVGCCGTAVATRATVVVENIANDPLWTGYQDLAAAHDLASCWSIPLLDEPRMPLGTFAIYHRHPHRPSASEIAVARTLSNAVTIAIKRQVDVEELIKARQIAEDANRAKSEFLAHMSHELRTPLNAIIGFSDAMRTGVFGPLGAPQYGEYASHIHASGTLLAGLIDGLLDLARIETGNLQLHREWFPIGSLADLCVQLVSPPSDAGVARMHVEGFPGDLLLHADRQSVARVLLNLLSNAVKHTPVDGDIFLRARDDADGLTLEIADTGIGISADNLTKIGKPFVRIETDGTPRSSGTGLGLFISRSLMELHQGSLTIASQVGKGTTVTVRFPAACLDRGPAPQ